MSIAARFASLVLVLSLFLAPGAASAESVNFVTADHIRVFADYQGGKDPSKPIILLFHQLGQNSGEYTGIAKHLNSLGYDTLAVDLRAGGPAYGRTNRTIAATGEPGKPIDALQDMEAAVDWADWRQHRTKIIAWGSSYSASLVFMLAAEDTRVKAVVAFSPDEYFSSEPLVHAAAAHMRQPALVSSASTPEELDAAASIFDNVPNLAKVLIKPKQATHGSATLNGSGAAAIWPTVEKFLASQK
jgi:dienelactone hydrolase